MSTLLTLIGLRSVIILGEAELASMRNGRKDYIKQRMTRTLAIKAAWFPHSSTGGQTGLWTVEGDTPIPVLIVQPKQN